MKMEKFSSKIEQLLLTQGFVKHQAKATSHVKYTRQAADGARKCSVIIPSKIRDGSKAITLRMIKRSLHDAGVKGSAIDQFNDIALGYMADNDDELSAREAILSGLIESRRDIEIAEAAMALSNAAAKMGKINYESRSIIATKADLANTVVKTDLITKIEKLIVDHIQRSIRAQFISQGYLKLERHHHGTTPPLLEQKISREFGVTLYVKDERDADYFELWGTVKGPIAKCFSKDVSELPFEIDWFVSEHSRHVWVTDSDGIEAVNVYLPVNANSSMALLTDIHDKLEQLRILAALTSD